MDCNETRRLLEADVDGELDLVRHLELEAHLKGCAECTRLSETLRARRLCLRESLPRFTAPSQFTGKVLAALRAEGAQSAVPARRPRIAAVSWPIWNAVGLAASVVFAVAVGYTWGNARAHGNLLIDEAISDHIRSLQFNHLSDVVSTDQHTVKPWFAGKLDFSPPVVDLADRGFPLVGGRLEHLDGQTAAALVFHRRLHSINLFVWPTAKGLVPTSHSGKNGYHAESWSLGGLNFMAVSEIPASDLEQFIREYRDRTK